MQGEEDEAVLHPPRAHEQRTVIVPNRVRTRQYTQHDRAKNGCARHLHLSVQQGDSQVAV